MIAPKPIASPLRRYDDAAHERQRVRQDRAVYLGDAPEAVRVSEIEIGEMIEPLAVAPQMLAELVLRRHECRGQRLHLSAAPVGRGVNAGEADVAALVVKNSHPRLLRTAICRGSR